MKRYLFYISQNYSFTILRPIQKILWARGDEVLWFFEGTAVHPSYLTTEEKKLDNIQQVFNYHPEVLLAPANSIPSFLPGLKVAVFHGFDAGKLDSRGRNDHFKIRGCFDLYCTQGPSTTQPFKELQKKYGFFNVIETGWSALDLLFKPAKENIAHEQPVVLFCSTFTRNLSCAKILHPFIKKLSESGHWQWIVQFHPKMPIEIVTMYKSIQSQYLRYIETDDIIPLLQKADVMLCDTSSVITMFLLQDKPVVTFKNLRPGPYLIDINSPALLEESIQQAISRPAPLMRQIKQFINYTQPYQDGRSSQRVVQAIDDVLAGKYPLNICKPFNLLRNLKFRKRLNYWKL